MSLLIRLREGDLRVVGQVGVQFPSGVEMFLYSVQTNITFSMGNGGLFWR